MVEMEEAPRPEEPPAKRAKLEPVLASH